MCAPHPSSTNARGAPRPYRVLLADDNRDAADSLAMLLDFAGCQTRVAYDGIEAVAAALDFVPDVAILDIDMPGLNGYEVAQRFRRSASPAALGLIALTGRGTSADASLAAEAGFDVHITKPGAPGAIIALVADLGSRCSGTPGDWGTLGERGVSGTGCDAECGAR